MFIVLKVLECLYLNHYYMNSSTMDSIVSFSCGLYFIMLSSCARPGLGVVIDCYRTTIEMYDGHQRTTHDRKPCVRWDSVNENYTKSLHRYPDATLSDAANYCRAMGKSFLWCSNGDNWDKCGIRKCDVNSTETRCGTLKIEQPVLLGRNVTFSFTPDTNDQNAILEWQRSNKINSWYTRPLNYKFTQFYEDGTYYMILTDSLAENDEVFYRIHYYNESTQCLMEMGERLILKDNPRNPCGFVYLRNERVVENEDIKLEYYPSETSDDSQHDWILYKEGRYSEIELKEDIYSESKKENGMFELTIHMIKQRVGGKYGVSCGTAEGITNTVTVIVQVPPVFEDLQDIDGYKKCIVGYEKTILKVKCKISDGTSPIKALVIIGDESFPALQNENDSSVYTAFFTIADRHHNATITCSIMNEALTSPLTTSTKVYVVKSPNVALSIPSEIKEGSFDVITCMYSSSRPPPRIYFNISGTEITSNFSNRTFNQVTLKTFKRNWNGKTISCCRYNEWYYTPRICSDTKEVNLLFPPSNIKLEIKLDLKAQLQVDVICTLYNSNPVCKVKFLTVHGTIDSEISSRNISLPNGAWNSKYAVNVNISREANGVEFTCAVKCVDFNDLDLRKTRRVVLPWEQTQLNDDNNCGTSNGILNGIIVGLCLSLAVLVIIMAIVIRKKRSNAEGKQETDQTSHTSNSLPPRVYVNVANTIYETLNDSTRTGQSNTENVAYETLDNS